MQTRRDVRALGAVLALLCLARRADAQLRPAPAATFPLQAVPLQLPAGAWPGSPSAAVSLLLLPIPVPVAPAAPAPSARKECNLRPGEDEYGDEVDYASKPKPRRPSTPTAAPRRPATMAPRDDDNDYEPRPVPRDDDDEPHRVPPRRRPAVPRDDDDEPHRVPPRPRPALPRGDDDEPHRVPPRRRPAVPRGDDDEPHRVPPRRRPAVPHDDDHEPQRVPSRRRPAAPRYPAYVNAAQLDETVASPLLSVAASSAELLAKFRAQAPTAPELPPVVLSAHDASERAPRPAPPDAPPSPSPAPAPRPRDYLPPRAPAALAAPAPPRPRFGSLRLRGELTVRRADYTETYTAWWDAASGAARVDLHGGATSAYRTPLPDGGLQRLEMRVDRSGERAVRRCARAPPVLPAPTIPPAHPALPDLELFSFAGYVDSAAAGERVERWQHVRSGRAGELGAARGEALSFRHELLLRRAAGDRATPVRYAVNVDSSLLGSDCDSYEHRYADVQELTHDPELFAPNVDDLCDHVEQLDSASAAHAARLDPLREFTLPHRDLQYDEAIERFKTEYSRRYVDNTEEAIRKNLLMQHIRFTQSGNREGATFELGINFLGDRLDAELDELLGVRAEPERERAESFPHSRAALRAEERELPERFDWRPRGGVSPVRYQGSCASCWAFAVAGAVEGALFVRRGRLTPLSEKCLVDCAHPFGGNGCKGTWPSHAYDYVQSRGLPALDDYPAYKDSVEPCAAPSARPATRISAHVNVTALSVPALQVAIQQHAPTVVIVDAKAKSFVFYKKGVLYDDRCGKAARRLNHALLAVGWAARRAEPHFVLKNSWSEAWGERGYVRVQARANTCGVLAQPSYPRLERADVVE